MTAVTLTPDYAAWYLAQTGTHPPHTALEGWRIDTRLNAQKQPEDVTWHSGSETSRAIRKMLGRPDAPGETWHTLVCEVGGVLGKVYVNVPARFVVAAGQAVKIVQFLRAFDWSEGRAA